MTAFYVDSAATGSNDGTSWTNAYTAFGSAVTAATGSGDVIYIDQAHVEEVAVDTVYTLANYVRVICSNDKANTPPQTLGVMGTTGYIGNSTTNRSISFSGTYCYGITFRTAGSTGDNIVIGFTDGVNSVLENCYIWNGNINSSSRVYLGATFINSCNSYVYLKDCTIQLGSTSQQVVIVSYAEMIGCRLSGSGENPTALFSGPTASNPGGGVLNANGCDFSFCTNTLVSGTSSSLSSLFSFSNCKLGSGMTIFGTPSPANKSGANIWLYNCSSADQHYHLQHHDAFGSTIVDTGIYANDGAQYDGTNYCSWKIVTTTNCSYYTPYVSPWIDCYHSGTSAITPSLEIVRSGSATAYQNDEVWGEFSYQGSSGFTLATIVNDRKALIAAAADQTTGALSASGWTGENATSWFGKLNPTATITPAEIGHLRARVCVGEPSITVYVDPTIRGRS